MLLMFDGNFKCLALLLIFRLLTKYPSRLHENLIYHFRNSFFLWIKKTYAFRKKKLNDYIKKIEMYTWLRFKCILLSLKKATYVYNI